MRGGGGEEIGRDMLGEEVRGGQGEAFLLTVYSSMLLLTHYYFKSVGTLTFLEWVVCNVCM